MKPKFDPNQPFQVIEKPPFDPNKPFKPTMLNGVIDFPKVEKSITKEDILQIVRSEIGKAISHIKPVEKVTEKVITEVPVEKKVIVKELDTAELKKLDEKIASLEIENKKLRDYVRQLSTIGGSGVIGLPKLGGNDGKYLTIENGKAKWKTLSAGGLTAGTYTVNNATDDRSFDADNTTIDELADVLATLISDLGGL